MPITTIVNNTAGNATSKTTISESTAGNATSKATIASTSAGNATSKTAIAAESAGNATSKTVISSASAGNATSKTTIAVSSAGNATSKTTIAAGSAGNATAQTAIAGAAVPRALVPLLDLDFGAQAYNQSGVPIEFSDLFTYSRASTGTYIGRDVVNNKPVFSVKTALANELRLPYDPVTGEKLGALLEGASTNLIQRSEEFDHAYFSKVNSAITANDTTAPDLTVTADKLEAGSTASIAPFMDLTTKEATTAAENYTYSIFIKPAEARFVQVYFASGEVANDPRVNFDFDSVAVGSQDADIDSATIEQVGNGWFRISLTVEAATTVIDPRLLLIKSSSDVRALAQSWDSGDGLYIWGAQLEELPFPSSYITTDGSAVTRTADDLTAPSSGNYTADNGSVFVDFDFIGPETTDAYVVTVTDGTNDNRLAINQKLSGGQLRGFIMNGGVTNMSVDGLAELIKGQSVKAAMTWSASGSFFSDGVIQGSDALVFAPVSPTVINIGYMRTASTARAYINIKKLSIFDQALTAQEVSLL